MQYNMKNIRIYVDTVNKPGSQFDGQEFHWLRCGLSNVMGSRYDPRQLPLFFEFDEEFIAELLPYAIPDPNNPKQFTVDEAKIKAEKPGLLFMDYMEQVTQTLMVPVIPIHTRDVFDGSGRKIGTKGEPLDGAVPTTSITFMVQHIPDPNQPDLAFKDMPLREPIDTIVRRILQRNYKVYNAAPTPGPGFAPEAPQAPTSAPEKSAEEKLAELEAKLRNQA